MALPFAPGDDLIYQLESGYGLLRVLATEERAGEVIWHLLAYEELFLDVESAEAALAAPGALTVRAAHLPLTAYAFEKTPLARLGNRPVGADELAPVADWRGRGGVAHERSALLMLGLR